MLPVSPAHVERPDLFTKSLLYGSGSVGEKINAGPL